MSHQFTSCPQCASNDIKTDMFRVRCGGCGWSLQDPDPQYEAHVQELGWANIEPNTPIIRAIDALPPDFGASLTTTRSAFPANHPVHADWPSLTAAEFRIRRETFGLSAEWLAERLGVALKTVQRWENGHRPIPDGVAEDMDLISTAMGEVAARNCAEHLLRTEDPVMSIPRAGTHFGFPASWYRALVDQVRHLLMAEYGDPGLAAATFRVVYFDEGGDQS
ncbi:helix-turn-helix domain-containing protein [Ornithinimicrobium flavum]|uniref:helix-turn-helix domain-containing protein n=1 Tax=Ornithinimicrobium flavum TaxID=1288636 RepID=UPI001931003B|nr:helix-turn-helix domain-containing protein [Ornithinimicrobium flavum]